MSSYCNTIAIGGTSYEYDLIWSQLSTNWFLWPTACESALSYTHWVRNRLLIAANARTLNLTTLNWSQVYSILQLSCFAIYCTESIPRHLGRMMSHSPQTKNAWSKSGLIRISPFGQLGSDVSNTGYYLISYMALHIVRCHNGSIPTTLHLAKTKQLEYEWILLCLATTDKVSCRPEITIDNSDYTTNTDLKIIHILFALGSIAVIGRLMWS
jgi:hypothetical protein